jgi:hypothetical protein
MRTWFFPAARYLQPLTHSDQHNVQDTTGNCGVVCVAVEKTLQVKPSMQWELPEPFASWYRTEIPEQQDLLLFH